MKKFTALAVLPLLLTACGGSGESDPESKAPAKASEAPAKAEKPKPKHDGAAYAKRVKKAVETGLMGSSIKSRCVATEPTWHCYFVKYESPRPEWIRVQLSFPGDLTDAEVAGVSEQARLHTFNLAGFEVADLETVVSYADGVDSGSTERGDVPILQ